MKALALRPKRPRKGHSGARDFRLIVQAIPEESYADRRLLSAAISDALKKYFRQALMSEAQRLLAEGFPVSAYSDLAELSPDDLGDYIVRAAKGEVEAKAEVIRLLCEFIFAQAETTLSWRIRLSPYVEAVLRIWERQNDGPQLLERLGKAEAIGMRVAQRKQFPHLDNCAEHELKKEAVMEMDALREKLRIAFPESRAITSAELLERTARR